MSQFTRPSTSYSTRPPTSYSTRQLTSHSMADSTSYQHDFPISASQRRPSISRTGSRPGTRLRRAASTIGGGEPQQIVCALSEARGTSPTVGLAFVNISTGEAVLSQICDNQFYVKTIQKLQVFEPTEILLASTQGPPNPKSILYCLIEEKAIGSKIVSLDRKYWSEIAGLDFIQQLAFAEDVEAIKVAIDGNYFATCCLAAVS
jgi:DNA mismatch repair protein MSH4